MIKRSYPLPDLDNTLGHVVSHKLSDAQVEEL